MKQVKMSKLLEGLLLNAVGASVVALGSLAMIPSAHAAIAGSKHDLGNTGSTNNRANATGLNGEICVFCHTPHGANTSAPGAPLWNKGTVATTFTTYVGTSMDALRPTDADIKLGASIACLSCHDGASAMDNLINAPGSGGYVPAGSDYGFTWTARAAATVSGAGVMGGTNNIAVIGADLTNDHPIGIRYCGATAAATDNATTGCRDTDFNAPRRNSDTSWWVDVTGVGTAGTKEKTDMQLYGRSGTVNEPRVECGSCHDPHNGGAGTQTFLRVTNQDSRVCLTCHSK